MEITGSCIERLPAKSLSMAICIGWKVGCLMKKPYQKPMIAVEYYSLTQAVASCSGVKINFSDSECVRNDPDSTNTMRNWAMRNGFLNPCIINLSGYQNDLVCYHTSVNAAFTS